MGSSYGAYYLVPLVTLWFLLVLSFAFVAMWLILLRSTDKGIALLLLVFLMAICLHRLSDFSSDCGSPVCGCISFGVVAACSEGTAQFHESQ